MSIDWQASLYDPIYAALGVTALLTPKETGIGTTLTVIDKTAGVLVDASTGGGRQLSQVQLQTIRPCADLRMAELIAKDISRDALLEAELKMYPGTANEKRWRVKTHQMRPGPQGENSGEVRLILLDEGGA